MKSRNQMVENISNSALREFSQNKIVANKAVAKAIAENIQLGLTTKSENKS